VLRPNEFPLQIVKRCREPFDGDEWLFEIKHDGFRVLAIRDGGSARLFTRNGYDISRRHRQITERLNELLAERFVLDGEMVVLDDDGRSNFCCAARRRRKEMALFEKTPVGAARTAAIAAQARVDKAAAAVKRLTDQRAPAVERHEAARAAADVTIAAIKNADLDAVAAEETGRELPDLSVLYAQRDQAALKVRATAARLEKIDAELQAANDELLDANDALTLALRGDTLVRMAKALEPAKAVDDELIAQGRGFGIADMIDQAGCG
jgi:hypothetical protein